MIDALKVFSDIAFEHISVFPGKGRITVHGCMSSFIGTAGVGIMNKHSVKERLNDIAKGMVHDSVAVRGGADQAFFGVVDFKIAVSAMAIPFSQKLALKAQQLLFQIEIIQCRGGLKALAFLRFASGN